MTQMRGRSSLCREQAIAVPEQMTPDVLPESGISVDVTGIVERSPDGIPGSPALAEKMR
jgi:hypothetical protein